MKLDKYRMDKEIEVRLRSEKWDREIAQKVIKSINKRRRQYIIRGVVAAVVFIVLSVSLFQLMSNEADTNLYVFIHAQQQGIFLKVFPEAQVSNYSYIDDGIDESIEFTLQERYLQFK